MQSSYVGKVSTSDETMSAYIQANMPAPLVSQENGIDSFVDSANKLCEEAIVLMQQLSLNEAVATLTKALQINPHSPLALAYRSDCYVLMGDVSSALEDLRSAIYTCAQLIEIKSERAHTHTDTLVRHRNLVAFAASGAPSRYASLLADAQQTADPSLVSPSALALFPASASAPASVSTHATGRSRIQTACDACPTTPTPLPTSSLSLSQLNTLQAALRLRLSALLATLSTEALALAHMPLALHLAQEAQHHHPRDPHHWAQRMRLFLLSGDLSSALQHASLVLNRAESGLVGALVQHARFHTKYRVEGTVAVAVERYPYCRFYPVASASGAVHYTRQDAYTDQQRMQRLSRDPLGHLRCVETRSKAEYVRRVGRARARARQEREERARVQAAAAETHEWHFLTRNAELGEAAGVVTLAPGDHASLWQAASSHGVDSVRAEENEEAEDGVEGQGEETEEEAAAALRAYAGAGEGGAEGGARRTASESDAVADGGEDPLLASLLAAIPPPFSLADHEPVPGAVPLSLSLYIEALLLRARLHLRLGLLDLCKRDTVLLLHLHPAHVDVLALLSSLRAAANSLALKAQAQLLVVTQTTSERAASRVVTAATPAEQLQATAIASASLAVSVLYTPRVTAGDEAPQLGSRSVLQLLGLSAQHTDTLAGCELESDAAIPLPPPPALLRAHVCEYESAFAGALTEALGGAPLAVELLLLVGRAQRYAGHLAAAAEAVAGADRVRMERVRELCLAAWTLALEQVEAHERCCGAGACVCGCDPRLSAVVAAVAGEVNPRHSERAVAWLLGRVEAVRAQERLTALGGDARTGAVGLVLGSQQESGTLAPSALQISLLAAPAAHWHAEGEDEGAADDQVPPALLLAHVPPSGAAAADAAPQLQWHEHTHAAQDTRALVPTSGHTVNDTVRTSSILLALPSSSSPAPLFALPPLSPALFPSLLASLLGPAGGELLGLLTQAESLRRERSRCLLEQALAQTTAYQAAREIEFAQEAAALRSRGVYVREGEDAWGWGRADGRGKDVLLEARRLLVEATALDPLCGEAWVSLADSALRLSEYERARETHGLTNTSAGRIPHMPASTRGEHDTAVRAPLPERRLLPSDTATRRGPCSFVRTTTHVPTARSCARGTTHAAASAALASAMPASGHDAAGWLALGVAAAVRAADVAPSLAGPVRARMAQAYAHVGRELFNTGHYAEAEAELDRAIACAPSSGALYLVRAKIRVRRGVLVGALDDLEACLKFDPANIGAQTLLKELKRMC